MWGGSSNSTDNEANNPIQRPEQDTTPDPEPTPSGYVVSFESNGGSTVASIYVSSGSTVEMPETPTKTSYVFSGWYKDKDFTEMFTFGADGDKVIQNITLYAQWIKLDTLKAQYAIGEIVIGYADGDNQRYVTRNLTLPSKAGDVNITWSSSNSAVISSAGTVIRPSGSDVEIKLTAIATSGTEAETKEFILKVIRARSRISTDIKVVPVQDAGSGDISITYKASSDQIVDIDGNYSNFKIENADDALEAVKVIRNDLGIASPDAELEIFVVTSDSSGAEYSFQQKYRGVKVFGRTVTASANSSGDGDFLHSNFLQSEVVERVLGSIDTSSFQSASAKSAAESHFSGNVKAVDSEPELVIYSVSDYAGDYEKNPVYAYIVRVSGQNSSGSYVDESVLVNAATGRVIKSFPNICEASTARVSTRDELGNRVNFPVVVYKDGDESYYLMANMENPAIQMFNETLDHPVTYRIGHAWTDGQQNSAYVNMIDVLNWWKNTFGRDSLDDKGMQVKVTAHERVANYRNNAFWNGEGIFFSDIGDGCDYSCASAIDTVAHESTHAVVQYTIPGGLPYENATGAINEAYADIFGCLKDHNWTCSEGLYKQDSASEIKCFRNIPESGPSWNIDELYEIYRTVQPAKNNDYNGVHTYSLIISRSAYLMYRDGLTWDKLGKLWYKSMHMGMAMPNFGSVRRCVVNAAKKLHMLPREIGIIEDAFTSVGIGVGRLSGVVTEYPEQSKTLEGVTVTLLQEISGGGEGESSRIVGRTTTAEDGAYSFRVEEGTYTVRFEKRGYRDIQVTASVKNDSAVKQDAMMIVNTDLSISGTIRDTATEEPVEGVTVNLRRGRNNQSGEPIESELTDEQGRYSFELDEQDSAEFSVELVKEGWQTSVFSITVSGGDMREYDGYIARNSAPVEVEEVAVDAEHFPDENFRKYVEGFDLDKDGVLSREERESVTGINLYASKISSVSSLEGLRYFKNLRLLDCYRNRAIRTLDVSGLTSLQELNCSQNNLTTLNVSGCSSLQKLDCSGNQLTTLDVSGLTSLQELNCSQNNLTTLNVSGCSSLQKLDCSGNQLTTLDVSGLTVLNHLRCDNNQLTALYVNGCTDLQRCYCNNNQLPDLDMKDCVHLQGLHCEDNQLVTLDMSSLTWLLELYCQNNQLRSLYLMNCTYLLEIHCQNNRLTEIDLSTCRNMNESRLYCDSGVNVIYPQSTNTQTALHPASSIMHDASASEIVAEIPEFYAPQTASYSFSVSLDRQIPAGSTLVLHSWPENSEAVTSCAFVDDTGAKLPMPTLQPLEHVNVSVSLNAGETHTLLIAANSPQTPQHSGGCSSGALGSMILLAGFALLKKH